MTPLRGDERQDPRAEPDRRTIHRAVGVRPRVGGGRWGSAWDRNRSRREHAAQVVRFRCLTDRPAESAVRADARAAAAQPRVQSPPGPLTRCRLSLPYAGNKKPLGNLRQGSCRSHDTAAGSKQALRASGRSALVRITPTCSMQRPCGHRRLRFRHPPTRRRKGRVEYSSATRCQEQAEGARIHFCRHASYPAHATAFERLRLRLAAAASRPVRSDR